jgi:hypothetical protein
VFQTAAVAAPHSQRARAALLLLVQHCDLLSRDA